MIWVDFVPIVVEALGGLAEDSVNVIRAFGESIALRVGSQDSATCTKQLFHRVVAMALWRGNATLWLHRQPSLPPTVDAFTVVCVYSNDVSTTEKKIIHCRARLLPVSLPYKPWSLSTIEKFH